MKNLHEKPIPKNGVTLDFIGDTIIHENGFKPKNIMETLGEPRA